VKVAFHQITNLLDGFLGVKGLIERLPSEIAKCNGSANESARLSNWIKNFQDTSSFILTATNGIAMNIPSLISLHYAFTRYAEAGAWA